MDQLALVQRADEATYMPPDRSQGLNPQLQKKTDLLSVFRLNALGDSGATGGWLRRTAELGRLCYVDKIARTTNFPRVRLNKPE